jgi:hypothetical protein
VKRKALLLSSSNFDGKKRLSVFRDFLVSPLGGFWTEQEIVLLEMPTTSAVEECIGSMASADFGLVLVVANGEEKKDERPWPEAKIDLADGCVNERQLNPGCPRSLLLFDCVESSQEAGALRDGKAKLNQCSRIEYDRALSQAEEGLVKVFAPKAAASLPLAPALVALAYSWAAKNQGILSLSDAIESFSQPGIAPTTTPFPYVKYTGGRRRHTFPLCINYLSEI